MNLLKLAPQIQQEPPAFGRGPVTERHLRRLNSTIDWSEQRRLWADLRSRVWLCPPRASSVMAQRTKLLSR